MSQREQAGTSHNYVREVLRGKENTDQVFPWLIDGDFLSGSFARNTKIRPLNDVDVMMIIDGHGLRVIKDGRYTNHTVRGGGSYGSPVHQLKNENKLISSKMVLESFKNALRTAFPNSQIQRDGQVINVYFESYDLGLDIVPAFHLSSPEKGESFYIPQGGGTDEWLETNPKKDIEISENYNAYHQANLIPLVKLIKYWNQENNVGLKSYHLEVMIWNTFANQAPIENYALALQYFFKNGYSFVNNCPDPTGIGDLLNKYINQDISEKTQGKFSYSEIIANKAINAEILGDVSGAVKEWNKIFPGI
jgi:hypothetical protein